MFNHSRGEIWKIVSIEHQTSQDQRLEVSNHGRIRTFNKLSDGNVIKGSIVNGYPVIRLKFFHERSKDIEYELISLRKQIQELQSGINTAEPDLSGMAIQQLSDLKIKLKEKTAADVKQRTIYYQSLIHRLVATYFLPAPKPGHSVVAHLDHDKTNNDHRNLSWMTVEENRIHQQKSPLVIGEREIRQNSPNASGSYKLSVTRVMFLKKLLNENKPIKNLAKQFRITETQVLRIQRGENWGNVKAAD